MVWDPKLQTSKSDDLYLYHELWGSSTKCRRSRNLTSASATVRLAKALLRHALLSPRCSALLLGTDRQDFGDMTPRRLCRFSLNGICRLKGAAIKMVRCHALTMKIHMVIHWWSIYGDQNIHGDPMIQWSIGDPVIEWPRGGMLCIILYNLCVYKELRTVWNSFRALMEIPRSNHTIMEEKRVEIWEGRSSVYWNVPRIGRENLQESSNSMAMFLAKKNQIPPNIQSAEECCSLSLSGF